ncbi:ROK family protein [Kineococcus arenarius]|uniref:ROK family protein n=1 Tax=Kineococcus sp. SYSU DK007 TaxID=3383128 RepID=UPI003D7CE353
MGGADRPGTSSRAHALAPASQLRRVNTRRIVELLRSTGPLTRADLVRASGLAKPTVVAIVTDLVASGVVLERGTTRDSGASPPRGGRPGTLLVFNAAVSTAVAVRLRPGELVLQQVSADGDPLAEATAPVDTWDGDRLITLIAGEVRRLCGSAGTLAAVSLVVAGVIDRGTVTLPARGWDRFPVQDRLHEALGVPVVVLSPATAAMAGEASAGAAEGHDTAVLVFLVTGLSVGLLSGGRLLTGARGGVGELGHCRTGSEPERECRCGRRGCLETVASGWAVRRDVASLGAPVAERTSLSQLAALRDPRVDTVLEGAARVLGAATAWAVNLLDPSVVVLADTDLTRGADGFFDVFAEAVRRDSLGGGELEVVRGTPDAVVRGAVQAALEQLPVVVRPRRNLGA